MLQSWFYLLTMLPMPELWKDEKVDQADTKLQWQTQWPREGAAQAPHSGSGWQLRPLALHTPGGQNYVTATARPTCQVLNLHSGSHILMCSLGN